MDSDLSGILDDDDASFQSSIRERANSIHINRWLAERAKEAGRRAAAKKKGAEAAAARAEGALRWLLSFLKTLDTRVSWHVNALPTSSSECASTSSDAHWQALA